MSDETVPSEKAVYDEDEGHSWYNPAPCGCVRQSQNGEPEMALNHNEEPFPEIGSCSNHGAKEYLLLGLFC
jgi:hypothetical protein